MRVEAATAQPLASPPPKVAVERRASESLTQRATLNAGASLLDYSAQVVVGLLLTPVLVRGLGPALFGIWEMVTRLASHVSATDGRSAAALRLVVAQRQGDTDQDVKRRFVGAALMLWLLVLPLVLTVGMLLVWLAPGLTNAPPALYGDVRLACVLLMASFLLVTMADVPQSVLRGENLGYKRMGVQAGLNLLWGLLAAWMVTAGHGIAGLGAARALVAVATGVLFWMLVRRFVRWFGANRPARAELRMLFGMGVWLSAGDFIARALLASDVIILGAVVAPSLVTTYVVSGYPARIAVGVHGFATSSAIPGLGAILGHGQFKRAARARHELLKLTWLFLTILGATVLLWNRSFITLWIGAQHYAGPWVNLLIVLIAAQTSFIRVDANIIDAALRPRQRVLVGAIAAGVTIALGIILANAFGMVGLCVSVLAGRSVQSTAYPLIAGRTLGAHGRARAGGAGVLRLAAVSAALFAGAAVASHYALAGSWFAWAAGVAGSLALFTALAFFLGPTAVERRALLERMRALRAGLRLP